MLTTPHLTAPRFRLHPLCYLFSLIPSFALAEPTMPQMEEITVTASKREQSLNEFSGSVTAINADSLDFSSGIHDIARLVPGFAVLETGPRDSSSLIIRGLRVDDVGENDLGGDGGSVASYVDNIPLQGYFLPPAFSLKDLERVEVLRGPQGTLYGNSSIGGLVRYITAKPDLSKSSLTASMNVSQTKESDDLNYDTDLVINAPLINDTLGVRLMLGKTENQGFIDNPYLLSGAQKDINDDETEQARVSVLWQASEVFSLAGSYHYQKSEVGDRQATNENFTGDKYTVASRYRQPMEGELELLSLDADYDFQWANLTVSVSRYEYDNIKAADQTDIYTLYDPAGEFYFQYEDFSAISASDVTVDKDNLEVRLVSPDTQALRWLVGAFYSTDDAALRRADIVPGFADFLGLNRPDDIDLYEFQTEDLKERSVYGELAYDLTPKWEVLVGVRSFKYEDEYTSCYVFPLFIDGTDLPLECVENDDDHDGTLGKFSTKYQFTPEQNIYLTIAEGYRRGGANPIPADIEQYRIYDPDTSVNYELGSHSYFFDKQLRISAALFYIDWEDIQITGVVEQTYGAILNAKGARSKGVELEVAGDVTDRLSMWANFSYTNAELTEDVNNFNGWGENIYAGDRLPGSPEQQWGVGVDYTQSIKNARLDAGLSVARIDEIYTVLNDELANYDRLDGFTTANARISLSFDQWRLGAFVNNISNSRGITGKRTAELYGERGQFEYITRPRTIGVSLRYRY
ncbi:TonB-dependent receptor [Cellvibrio sp. ARAG 10.3]|uniref:TonB-dependent receptor n=1 Tax=Cellvibrio sp. ARAG 10.3 TaxID=3451358 RepID=UPI003F6E127F